MDFSTETLRGKLELDVEGRKGFGQIQWRNRVNEGVELWGYGGGWERADT